MADEGLLGRAVPVTPPQVQSPSGIPGRSGPGLI